MYLFCVGMYVCMNVLLCTHTSLSVWKSEDRLVGPLSPLAFGSLGLVFGPVSAADARMGTGAGAAFQCSPLSGKWLPLPTVINQGWTFGVFLKGYFVSRGFWILPCLAYVKEIHVDWIKTVYLN